MRPRCICAVGEKSLVYKIKGNRPFVVLIVQINDEIFLEVCDHILIDESLYKQ